MRCCPEHVCIYIQIYTHTTCNFFFTDEELLSHPWNTAMLEVMVQLTDDNPMSIATTLDMLQLVNMIAQIFVAIHLLGGRVQVEIHCID